MNNNTKPVYIMSLEASDIYYHSKRGMSIKKEYVGMIPFSLELMKLKENKLSTRCIKDRDKYISDDIINVKFNSKVKNADEMLDVINRRLNASEDGSNYESNLLAYKEKLEMHSSKSDDVEYWGGITINNLRKELYCNGFIIRNVNKDTGVIRETEYVVYKRSSAKSRTGQCLFIKKSLFKKMINWSRMNLPLKNNMKIDLASLLAYESLVGSSIEDTIVLDVDKILIVDDVDSKFKKPANVVMKDDSNGHLNSFYKEDADISNSIFDGESLLDAKYFKNSKSMMLLRNHMFKSASFSCNIQDFLKDNCPANIEFESWKIKNMFGEEVYAKDIDMICTPSSVKALKFSHVLKSKTDKEMWNYWKYKVKEDGNIFGICKYEKPSKLGDIKEKPLQQTSYQMINCLPAKSDDIRGLISLEVEYINKMKKDNDFLINEIYKKKDLKNSNEALYFLYNHNKELAETRVFRDFKKFFINRKVSHAKRGKIKIEGDYCVMLGNPIELLYHAIGKFNIDNHELDLVGNQVYTSLFDDGEKLIGFRNPNTSPSNVLIVNNKKTKNIKKYLNLTPNIVVVNAINFEIQDILSGCDYDSDTVLLSNNRKMVELGEKCFGYYPVCINNIKGDKKSYRLNKQHHFEIDNQLSESQYNIGKVVNLGQLCMSVYWQKINNGINDEKVKELLKKVDVMTVLSGIAIDMAKKFYDIDIKNEINNVASNELLKEFKNKPNFWIYVSQNKKIKNKVEHFDCPMDYLMVELSKFEHSNKNKCVKFANFINSAEVRNVDTRQVARVMEVIKKYNFEIKNLKSQITNDKSEIHTKIEDISLETFDKMKKWKLRNETIAYLLKQTYEDFDSLLLKLIKLIYEISPEKLMDVIKKR